MSWKAQLLCIAAVNVAFLCATPANALEAITEKNIENDVVKISLLILNKDGSTQMERAAHLPFYSGELIRVKIISQRSGTLQLTNINPAGKITPLRPITVQAGAPAYYPPENNAVLEFSGTTGNEILRVSFSPGQASPSLPDAGQSSTANPVGQTPGQMSVVVPVSTTYNQLPLPSGGAINGNYSVASQQQNIYNQIPAIPSTTGSTNTVNPTNSAAAGASQQPTRPSEFFSDVQGKAYAKDIRETVIEAPDATYLVRPANSGPLQFEITIQHRNF